MPGREVDKLFMGIGRPILCRDLILSVLAESIGAPVAQRRHIERERIQEMELDSSAMTSM